MSKKTIIQLVVFLLLGGLAMYFINADKGNKPSSMMSARDLMTVSVEDMDEILVERKNDLDLRFDKRDDGWYVNKYYKANPNTVSHLVNTIADMDMIFIPPKTSLSNVLRDMDDIGIDVTVFKNGKKQKAFTVGANTLKNNGTYFLPEGSKQPYAMSLRSFDGTLRDRFNYKFEDWRDKTLIEVGPNEISKIKMVFPKSMKNSYEMNIKNGNADITPLDPFRTKFETKPVQSRVDAFLLGFDKIGAEGFDNNNPQRDSISKLTPFLDMTLDTKTGASIHYVFIPFRDIIDPSVNTKDLDDLQFVERYFVVNKKTNDFLVIQQRVFKEVLRSYGYFF